jgi:homogentisate 1,2-dioxygenase
MTPDDRPAVAAGEPKDVTTELDYLSGFGNKHETEAEAGALPKGRNSPQRAPLGLYAEQLNGTAFTAPRAKNLRSWQYRIRPSVRHGSFRDATVGDIVTAPGGVAAAPAAQLRWDPLPMPKEPTNFLQGWRTYAVNGDAHSQIGTGVHCYVANRSMENNYFCDADGELLIVPQFGTLMLRTEAGQLTIAPGEICVVPRGFKFAVDLMSAEARGYISENYGAALDLPERGPIGANSLANPRDFQYPVAAYEDNDEPCELFLKFDGRLHVCDLEHSPLDVVAWHGNCAPYKYDLRLFNVIGSISYDHPDPSIFTVLTSPTDTAGVANLDFVIFPPRWLVAEDTFRPPWFHRNVMSEFMGLIYGQYDAKPEGFVPGGASLHNCMLPHGPDTEAFEAASKADLKPQKLDQTMAFMFESRYLFRPTRFAMEDVPLQGDYASCWSGLEANFGSSD